MSNAKRILHNTVLLTVTAFIIRTVSVSFNVYLTNKIGADGIGLFQLIFAVYATAITFASAGVRLASTRLTADNNVLGRQSNRQIIFCCLIYSLICGVISAVLLLLGVNKIGSSWIGDVRSIPSIKMLCLGLPFVSLAEALNGYFTSVGKLVRFTGIQLFEQIFKIAVTVIALKNSDVNDIASSCRAVTFGIATSEIFAFVCTYILYRFSCEKDKEKESMRGIFSRLLKISLPIAIGSEMRSILVTVEHLLIPVGFKKSGSNSQAALSTYGVIHGMSLPLVLYPSALLSSLSGLLVPEISANHIAGNKTRISYMISRVLHITLIFSIGTAGIMYFNAEKLSLAVYGNTEPAFYIRILSPLIPIMYTDMSVDGMLKGLDRQVSYMKYNLIDASICVVLVYLLVPISAVKGYIIVVFISETVNFYLSFRMLTRVSEVKIELFKDILIPLLCVISANLLKNILFSFTPELYSAKASATIEIVFSITAYCVLLLAFRVVDREETAWIKNIIKPKKVLKTAKGTHD